MAAVGRLVIPNQVLRIEFKHRMRPNQIAWPTIRALISGTDVTWYWDFKTSHPKVADKEAFEMAVRRVNHHLLLGREWMKFVDHDGEVREGWMNDTTSGLDRAKWGWRAYFRASDVRNDERDIAAVAFEGSREWNTEFDEWYNASRTAVWAAMPELLPF